MRALVITAPGRAEIHDVPIPQLGSTDALIEVHRAGICGTDVEFFTGEMAYLHSGQAAYPMRIGHEWMGVVVDVGTDVDRDLIGARVTGDTMLGCGTCRRCLTGRQHVCAARLEVGIRHGKSGALAELLAVPARSLHRLPDAVDDAAGALVEPGGNAYRAVAAANLTPGDRLLITGTGAIGSLCALFARASGAEVHLLGRSTDSLSFARSLSFANTWMAETLPGLPWDAVIEASNASSLPPRALSLVEPGRRVVYIGIAGEPSPIDTRDLVLRDITAVGILSASPGLAPTITAYAEGAVEPGELVAATIGLAEMIPVLAGERPPQAGRGPKFHADPRLRG